MKHENGVSSTGGLRPKPSQPGGGASGASGLEDRALDEHLRTGGSTFDPRSGENMVGKNEWAVGISPESSRSSQNLFSPEEYAQFVAQHGDTLRRHQNSAIGTHYDPATNLHHIELVGLTPNKHAALQHAAQVGDRKIFHLGRSEHAAVPHSGAPPLIPHSVDHRLTSLHEATPPRQSFRGTHFSPSKFTKIDGSRRGQSGTGAESSRLHSVPNAPPGFHVYADGSLPQVPPDKLNSYPVEGRYSFASTKDPVFQNAYAQAFGSSGDHSSALNSAELATRDAGYDGYYNAKQPDSRFIFGDYPVRGRDE